ncbi:MAG: HAD-IB family hydrolase [Acidimicrobiia bacterium]|nr:HAD-IB family hydrolase [Acidimicrobiia bacterium]
MARSWYGLPTTNRNADRSCHRTRPTTMPTPQPTAVSIRELPLKFDKTLQVISEALAGRRLAITGTTGFLGTALVERLLRCVPDVQLVLLVRPGRRGADERIHREIIRNDVFDRLRHELGQTAFDQLCEQQITGINGDVGVDGLGLDNAGRDLISSCDIVIHSAAAVAFDNPLDTAVEVNLLGPVRLVQLLNEMGASPHFIAVSTCYVAGSRRGNAAEEPLLDGPMYVPLSWREEVEASRRRRITTETQSRDPACLEEFRNRARHELGAAGTPALAAKTEQLRSRWVHDQMVEAGRSRASSLGFPDAYAFTKALAETAVAETKGDLQVTTVRPSIIESTYSEPVPGWIRGFRMAEPIIIGYGRGLLTDFPGIPQGVLDVIPVDLVAAALCAVAARGPDPSRPVIQVASGAVNPFRFNQLVDLTHRWFSENPIYDDRDQPIPPPNWTYPGRGRVIRQLKRLRRGLDASERLLGRLPIRGRQAEISANLDERREQVERALGYVELYGAYTECEALFGVERLLELWDSLDDNDKESYCFDPRIIDWNHYVADIHLPTVVAQGRVKTEPTGRAGSSRQQRQRAQVLSPKRHLAAFDLENTIIATNVVVAYGWLATHRLPINERTRLITKVLLEAPSLLALDRRDRSDFLRHFYRRYEGAPVKQMAEDSRTMFSDLILTQAFPAAIRRVREHRAAGHTTVLITGALDFIVDPLRPLFDHIVCAELAQDHGTYTGHLASVPPTSESRAEVLRDFANAEGLSLSESVAYADSASDLPLLEAVGYPVTVNPEPRLAILARKRGWLIEHFDKAQGSPRKLLPISARQPT